jgi:hypothetical protein
MHAKDERFNCPQEEGGNIGTLPCPTPKFNGLAFPFLFPYFHKIKKRTGNASP